ncbi:hypothetical protein BD311DRAFT_712819 [Dichomitus squalens]|uniref:DUF4604 domain-containing protein n=1 Tax=Dichomitus squalens TaxID=114155 RepID=A0A4V6MW31_9APHY|nr:hypothetical protein BD311DRAFT_712819 [Dichomitus squalens]
MSKKEPTRAQLSSRLAYQSRTPAFLLRMQQGLGGGGRRDDDDDDEFEDDGSGRPPIPKRPAIPERPDGEPGSADEDDLDEKPQVVVLRQGKHLTEREVENERRKAKGLPPLPEPTEDGSATAKDEPSEESASAESKASKQPGLSFGTSSKAKGAKRKAVGDGRDDADKLKPDVAVKATKKKAKKQDKKLLSFAEDA